MQWIMPTASKGEVQRAARVLLENSASTDAKLAAQKTLANYRSSHAYPLHSMRGFFRATAMAADKKAIVVQRLKRLPSLLAKLRREAGAQEGMKHAARRLTTMGDIGGSRLIVSRVAQVKKISAALQNSRTKNKLLACKDYLAAPKPSGYRAIHLLYSYQGSKTAFHNYRVELQIRSRLQHAWATAVEVAGTFNGENLKAGQGSRQWLDFFKLVSVVFADMENGGMQKNRAARRDLKQAARALRAAQVLQAYKVVAEKSNRAEGYYLLTLDSAEKWVMATHYPSRFMSEAFNDYRLKESEIEESAAINRDVVLVSGESIKDLKKGYTNYFADTQFFIEKLKEAVGG